MEAIISLICSPTEMNVFIGRFRADFKVASMVSGSRIQDAVENVLKEAGIDSRFQRCKCEDHCIWMQYVFGMSDQEHQSLLREMVDALDKIRDFA